MGSIPIAKQGASFHRGLFFVVLDIRICGYDVKVTCDLAKVNIRVRFSVPAPNTWVMLKA